MNGRPSGNATPKAELPTHKLRTVQQLDRAIREGEQAGARLMAGAAFSDKAERERIGAVLYGLADFARRAQESGRLAPMTEGGTGGA